MQKKKIRVTVNEGSFSDFDGMSLGKAIAYITKLGSKDAIIDENYGYDGDRSFTVYLEREETDQELLDRMLQENKKEENYRQYICDEAKRLGLKVVE